MRNFIKGILTYFEALSFIGRHGLTKYFIYSGLIGLLLFGAFGALIYSFVPVLSGYIDSIIPWDFDFSTDVYSWISGSLAFLLFVSGFKYLMLICTAPLMSVLSERVEMEITGEEYDHNTVMKIIPELIRGIRINFRNLIRELFLTLLLLILGLIPVLSLFSAILIFLVQGYFAGFGNHDFWAERHFTYSNTVRFMKSNKGMLAGNGVVYVFLVSIPILGAFIAPPLATIASTMDGLRELEKYD